ncbi:MAG: RNase P subunit p30 family protein [Nanoarchaeota archaeon]
MNNLFFINENDFMRARDKIRKIKDGVIVFSSDDDELNRKILEKEKINVLLLNQRGRKDHMKQRESGLNHVLAKEAKKNDVAIGINLDEIIESRGRQRAEILARIRQNIKLCNKSKLKMRFLHFKHERSLHDLKSFGLVLGMPTWMTKNL